MQRDSHFSQSGWHQVLAYTLILTLFFEIFSGVLRYTLSKLGVVQIVYLPKALVLFLGLYWLLNVDFKIKVQGLCIVFFILEAVWALYMDLTPAQIAFGFWIIQPIFFGFAAYQMLVLDAKRMQSVFTIALVVTSIGILYTAVADYSWVDSGYTLAGQEIEATRQWSTFEYARPPGFSRMSVQAGSQILIISMFLLPFAFGKSPWMALIILLIAIVVSAITTTKIIVVAILLTGFIFVFRKKIITPVFIITVGLFSAFFPLTSREIKYGVDYAGWLGQLLLASLDMRLDLTWPLTLELLEKYGNVFLGRGLGGLGSAEKLFGYVSTGDALNYFVVDLGVSDSYALYLFGNFGLIGLMFYAFHFMVVIKLIRLSGVVDIALGVVLFGILMIGLTADVIENPLISIFIGMAFSSYTFNSVKSRIAMRSNPSDVKNFS